MSQPTATPAPAVRPDAASSRRVPPGTVKPGTGRQTVYSDPSSWLPLDGLAPGFDGAKADPSPVLDGRAIALEDGSRYRFAAGRVSWSSAECAGGSAYEAFEVAEGLVYAQYAEETSGRAAAAVSLVLDLERGWALRVTSTVVGAGPGRTAVAQRFEAAAIAGCQSQGRPPSPSDDLVGRRVMWVYSGEHAYEHVYLSPGLYTWQCLAGPERGLADTDECTVYCVRPGIYVFAWREKVIPCASVTVADHRRLTALRSHGVLFGLDASAREQVHFTFGAHGRLLSQTVHPAEHDPARPEHA
ncbi:MoaF C-terminal domain-containing protein [Sinomonas halotolerans]|uniref:MoaF C-terminal domain-containing protein n=1 Tax=Sinomonas halotolerans TaxID=1644133 RepID=A0ABU9WWV8_9MICC